jgi:hypothetical protein
VVEVVELVQGMEAEVEAMEAVAVEGVVVGRGSTCDTYSALKTSI